jgi:hypothetical protein
MTRVIGPPRSRRRRWTFLWCLVIALGVGTFFVAGAQAVHATGIFQLDSDASQSLNTDGNAGQSASSEDWDNVCARYVAPSGTDNNPGAFCHPVTGYTLPSPTVATGTNGRSTFITDGFNVNDSVFKGGTDVGGITSADGIGGSLWQWKTASAPDKSDIEQAFAAEYTCNAATHCTNAAYSGHTIIYFGGTRYADGGDTNLGFWFLHNSVTPCGDNATCASGSAPACPVTSGCGFTGGHQAGNCSLITHPTPCTPGDIFVASAFTSHPTIQIYEFVGLHHADTCITSECDLNQVPFPVNAATGDNTCTTSASDNDAGCAIINKTAVASPWTFSDKTTGAPANTFGSGSKGGELFEGGLDLTQLGFGGACISTFMLNTRSSGSGIGSVDQDFALGTMGTCGSTLTTTAGLNGSGTSINNGSTSANGTASSGTDSATVAVTGVATWSGTVDFYLCGPIATGVCTNGGVKLNGTTGNVGVPVNQNTTNGTVTSGSATLTSKGRYCWFAHFTSNTTGVPGADEDGSGDTPLTGTTDPNPECFTVSPVTPSINTVATDSSGTALCTPQPCTPPATSFGQAVYDTATVSGLAREPGSGGANSTYPTINPTVNGTFHGTITFTLKLDAVSPATGCGANATGTGTNPQSVDVDTATGNKLYGPVSFTPGTPGHFHWTASLQYVDASNNNLAVNNNLPQSDDTSCDQSREAVIVQQITPVLSTKQFVYPQDKAKITCSPASDCSSTGTGNLAGTATFKLYNTAANCAANTATGLLYGPQSFPISGAAPQTAGPTTNTSAAVTSGTTVYWRVTYTSTNPAQTDASTSSCTEQTTVSFAGDDSSITVP